MCVCIPTLHVHERYEVDGKGDKTVGDEMGVMMWWVVMRWVVRAMRWKWMVMRWWVTRVMR